MDFDNPKVYGDKFISDGLVFITLQDKSIIIITTTPNPDLANKHLLVHLGKTGVLDIWRDMRKNRTNILLVLSFGF